MPLIKVSTGFSELLPVKNIDGVIRAISKNSELWVVGDGPEKSNLKKLAKELDKKVIFWGRVDNQKARKIMRKSDVFILNSFHEGMPHALIEALAEKVPVIATKIPAVTEILTDRITGLLVNINDPKDLAKKISQIEDYPELAKNGRKLFEKEFIWDKHMEKLTKIFTNLAYV